MTSPVSIQLDRQYRRLHHQRPRRQLAARWRSNPALAGRSAAEIVTMCERGTPAQNPVVSSLLDLHQHGDPDAGTILLTALRPMVKSVIVRRHGSDIADELLDNYWSAASHLIGTVDPRLAPTDQRGEPIAFITHLGNRLFTHLRMLDPAARRWHDRRKQGRLVIPVDMTPKAGEAVQSVRAGSNHDVESTVLARLELQRVADAVDGGQIAADRWQQLLEHRLGVTTNPRSSRDRVAVHRTSHRLAGLVGHAA